MADNVRSSNSRGSTTRSKPPSSHGKREEQPSPGPGTRQQSDILSQEEEYKRLNAELEAKTASLVQEAEMVMREQENTLAKSRLLDNINTEDFLQELDDDYTERSKSRPRTQEASPKAKRSSPTPRSAGSKNSRPSSGKRPPASAGSTKSKPAPRIADDVAIPDDTFLTGLQQQMSELTAELNENDDLAADDDDDDIIPQAGADMGSEATIRFLKAKLRVMQEELDRLAHENHKKEEAARTLQQRAKEAEEERGRLTRANASLQQQVDKHKKLYEDVQGKTDSLETQLTALRKELESSKRNQRQQASNQSATEVRLNRALEEIDKYKAQLQNAKTISKDSSEVDRRRVEQLLSENKRLEKQKNELMGGFRKQMKLIDVLKRQKMHIEAAKMMQFSEDEFVKALEWGS